MRGLQSMGIALGLAVAVIWPWPAAADPARDFRAADANSDGILEMEEFRRFIDLRAEDGSAVAKRVRTFKAYGIALGRVDYDGDGKVSGDELRQYDKNNP